MTSSLSKLERSRLYYRPSLPKREDFIMALDAPPSYEIQIVDVEYQRQGDRALMGTLYRPIGAGPFAAVLEVHGGAWTSKDRFNNADTAKILAKAGIVVLSIDFRMPPEAAYPGSLQDINLAIRWLKAHAPEYGSAPQRVGAYGTSSGGHQVLLAALRPDDPRYGALKLPGAPGIDASLAFVVSGWGVLDPLARYQLAQKLGKAELVKNHDAFWGSVEAMAEGSPPLILERGEPVSLPPALVFQGTEDEWTSVAQARRLASLWREAGGVMELDLYEGERHTFVNDHPERPNSIKAVEKLAAFVQQYGGWR
jgi:acetyl esterase/lipase